MCTNGIRDRVSIDTLDRHLDRVSIDSRSTIDRYSIDISIDTPSRLDRHIGRQSLPVDQFSQKRRRVSIDTSGDHTFTVGRHSADVSIATLWSTVRSMSVACRSPGGDISV